MHNALYENQEFLSPETILQIALALELDMALFQSSLDQGLHQTPVRRDFLSGLKSEVNGTPSLFINEEKYEGPIVLFALISAFEGFGRLSSY